MAAKLFQRSWRSASVIDTSRLFSCASRFAPASQFSTSECHNNPSNTRSNRNSSKCNLLSNLPLMSSHRSLLSTFASPMRNLADPKRDHNKPVHDPYVMNLTVRDSNVIKLGTSDRQPTANGDEGKKVEKLSLVQRFKALYKQYWYVMLPVHVVTSTGWMVGFYYISQRYLFNYFIFFLGLIVFNLFVIPVESMWRSFCGRFT